MKPVLLGLFLVAAPHPAVADEVSVTALSDSGGGEYPWATEVTLDGCQLQKKSVQNTSYGTATYIERLDIRLLGFESTQGWFVNGTAQVSIPYAGTSDDMIERTVTVSLQISDDKVVEAVEREIDGQCNGMTCTGTRATKSVIFIAGKEPTWPWLTETMETLAALATSCTD